MKFCRLIVMIIGLIASTNAFGGKCDREEQRARTAQKTAKDPTDELLDALSMIFETTDHHKKIVMGSPQTMPQIELEHRPKYGDKMPQNVETVTANGARERILQTLRADPTLFYSVIAEEDIWLTFHYCNHLDASRRWWVLPLTRAVWASLANDEDRNRMVLAYQGRFNYAVTDPELKEDLINNTPYPKPEKNKRVRRSPSLRGGQDLN